MNLEIGRKLIYLLSDGTILKDTGEKSGGVMELTIEEEYPEFDSETMGVLEYPFGYRSEEILAERESWSIVDGELVIVPKVEEPAPMEEPTNNL